MLYIGVDNGVSGSIAVLNGEGEVLIFSATPTQKALNYTKKISNVTRVDFHGLFEVFNSINSEAAALIDKHEIKCLIERPMINPMRFQASLSAIRALEATLIFLEELKMPYQYIDSKEWQKVMLPAGIYKTKIDKAGRSRMVADPKELKRASKDIAKRIFPSVNLDSFNDGDSLLIAEYLRRKEKGMLK
jgi:hypothetical protein